MIAWMLSGGWNETLWGDACLLKTGYASWSSLTHLHVNCFLVKSWSSIDNTVAAENTKYWVNQSSSYRQDLHALLSLPFHQSRLLLFCWWLGHCEMECQGTLLSNFVWARAFVSRNRFLCSYLHQELLVLLEFPCRSSTGIQVLPVGTKIPGIQVSLDGIFYCQNWWLQIFYCQKLL